MRFAKDKVTSEYGMYIVNYLVCVLLSLFFMEDIVLYPNVDGAKSTLIIGAISGLLYLLALYYYDVSVGKTGVVLTSIFKKSGIIFPVLIVVVIFGEKITVNQIIGIVLSLCAIVLVNYQKNSFKKVEHIEVLLLCMCIGGITDSTNNLFYKLGNPKLKDQYFFYTFLFAALCTLVMMVITKKGVGKHELLYGTILGIPNYLSTRFLTMALFSVPAVITYPAFFMLSMVGITLAGVILFKEKIDIKKIVAIAVVIVAMILLNI